MAKNKLGLSLSGGGYRAAAFHLGTMRKLHELGILQRVEVMSTISGGSITGACYCTREGSFDEFEAEMEKLISTKSVIRYIFSSFIFIRTLLFILLFLAGAVYSLFTDYAWLSVVLLVLMLVLFVIFQFRIFPVSKVIEKAYDDFFYHKVCLSDLLQGKPKLAIGSTNLQTSRPFTFSRGKMEDSFYANLQPPVYFKTASFPLSRAVMASSCVPFAFTPVKIAPAYYINQSDAKRINPTLVDGGVYDNQGIHKLTQPGSSFECETIITSDAGNKLPFQGSYNNILVLLIRTMDVFMNRIKNVQMIQYLYNNTEYANRQIAYLSLGWDIETCIPGFINNLQKGQVTGPVIESHKIPGEWVKEVSRFREQIQQLLEQNVDYKKIESEKMSPAQLRIARSVGTNLTCLSMEQIGCLAGHAANITELQVRLYCPALISETS